MHPPHVVRSNLWVTPTSSATLWHDAPEVWRHCRCVPMLPFFASLPARARARTASLQACVYQSAMAGNFGARLGAWLVRCACAACARRSCVAALLCLVVAAREARTFVEHSLDWQHLASNGRVVLRKKKAAQLATARGAFRVQHPLSQEYLCRERTACKTAVNTMNTTPACCSVCNSTRSITPCADGALLCTTPKCW